MIISNRLNILPVPANHIFLFLLPALPLIKSFYSEKEEFLPLCFCLVFQYNHLNIFKSRYGEAKLHRFDETFIKKDLCFSL